jgi:4-nitrophenyl phosphatase
LDFDITYSKITEALNFVAQNNEVIVCNRDRNYLVENNELRPGCGSLVAAIEFAAGKTFDCIVGKPNTYMMELL